MTQIALYGPTPWPFPTPVVPGTVTTSGQSYSADAKGLILANYIDVGSLLNFGFTTNIPVATYENTGFSNTFTDQPAGDLVTTFQALNGITLSGALTGIDSANTLIQAYPSTPFVVKGFVSLLQNWQVNGGISGDSYGGLGIRNEAGALQTIGLLNPNIGQATAEAAVLNWDNASALSGTQPATPIAGTWAASAALAFGDDGTNLTYYYSLDPDTIQNAGCAWYEIMTVAKSDNFITDPNAICLFLSAHASAAALVLARFNIMTGSATP